jgi:Mg2+ and Co2+ transporter CorA
MYMQEVYDHLVRVTDTIDTYRDLLSSALHRAPEAAHPTTIAPRLYPPSDTPNQPNTVIPISASESRLTTIAIP